MISSSVNPPLFPNTFCDRSRAMAQPLHGDLSIKDLLIVPPASAVLLLTTEPAAFRFADSSWFRRGARRACDGRPRCCMPARKSGCQITCSNARQTRSDDRHVGSRPQRRPPRLIVTGCRSWPQWRLAAALPACNAAPDSPGGSRAARGIMIPMDRPVRQRTTSDSRSQRIHLGVHAVGRGPLTDRRMPLHHVVATCRCAWESNQTISAPSWTSLFDQ